MENHQTIAANSEFELPAEIIQQIQSFMREREAARTTLLSKSWYGAWCTRPNLSFNQHEFRRRLDEFSGFTKKTTQRYEELNLKIKTFSLDMYYISSHSLATELILKAIKLGSTDIKIEIPTSGSRSFVLPDEVFESETLARLSLNGFAFDIQMRRKKEVTYYNLKSLNLTRVTVNGDLFRDLISRCPLIEELTLEQPKSLLRMRPFYVYTIIKLHKLKYLRLMGLDIEDSLCRHDFWPKFPCLKELVIWNCFSDYAWNGVRICSPSLERITICLYVHRNVNAEFDVPNIRKFKFWGYRVPRLEFKTTSRGWESDIHIYGRPYRSSASWFSSLNMLVEMLSLSRVSLYISSFSFSGGDGNGYVGDGLPIPAVESLTIEGFDALSPGVLDALFCSCRPHFLNIDRRCMQKLNVEVLPQLRSLPWKTKTLLDDPSNHQEFICFRLK